MILKFIKTMEIPLTKIRNLYNLLREFSTSTHISIMNDFNRKNNYKKLIDIYKDSKRHFSKYLCNDSFINEVNRKELPTNPNKISNTNDLVTILEKNCINVVNNKELNFKYLKREVSTLRTTGNAKFESGQSGRSSGTGGLDFIGWNSTNNIPILGEIKVLNDENPFFALIQLLTYLSELSTPNQIERINNTSLFDRNITSPPQFYLYTILSSYNNNSKERQILLNGTLELMKKLKNEIADIFDIVILKLDEPTDTIKQIL